jgi:AcrR family transcriptional regulator
MRSPPTRTPPRLNRAEKKAQTRSDIAAAARRVFLVRGFHPASLDEIAEEAGYTKGAVYSNFAGKDDLFLAVLEEHYAARSEEYAALILADEDVDATFRRIARYMFDAYRREPAWWPLISDFANHASRDEQLRRRFVDARDRFLATLAGQIADLCARHRLTFVLPPPEVARGVGALIRGMAVEWAIDPAPQDSRSFEEMLSAYLRGLAEPTPRRSTP